MDMERHVEELLEGANAAAAELAAASTALKDDALRRMAHGLRASAAELKAANQEDLEGAEESGLAAAMMDRLRLTDERIEGMAQGLETVARLTDPVGEVMAGWTRPNGLRIEKVRVPIGVILMIYESRPNVTADAGALCLKSGNAAILRGAREAVHSNLAIHEALAAGLRAAGLAQACIQLVRTADRRAIDLLVQARGRLDLVIPRGGEGLIRAVEEKARVPVIKHYKGVCHTFVDASADPDLARRVCLNAKLQRPGVCNAMETLLVHADIAPDFLPGICARLSEAGCELRGCSRTRELVRDVKPAAEDDWATEYADLILSIKIVDNVAAAIAHVARYGSRHSDAIITRDLDAADAFTREVDSAVVFVNTSTRFNDGGQFGFGAEIGISTDKLHARGPMALPELTSYKYVVRGNGQVRE